MATEFQIDPEEKQQQPLTPEQFKEQMRQNRQTNAAEIGKDLTAQNGAKTFSAKININNREFDASVVIGGNGNFQVSMYRTEVFPSGDTKGTSMKFQYKANGDFVGKEGRQDNHIAGTRVDKELIGMDQAFEPATDLGDIALAALKVAKGKKILPKARV
jgi:hypothetical protein